MIVRKLVASAALAAAMGTGGMALAGTASADPGLHVSAGGHDVVKIGSGSATTSKGNLAIGLNGGNADASGKGTGNVAIANHGPGRVEGLPPEAQVRDGYHVSDDGHTATEVISNNNLVAVNNTAGEVDGGSNNSIVGLGPGGGSYVIDGNNNRLFSAGPQSIAGVVTGDDNNVVSLTSGVTVGTGTAGDPVSGQTVVARCGKSVVSAQSAKVTVSGGCS